MNRIMILFGSFFQNSKNLVSTWKPARIQGEFKRKMNYVRVPLHQLAGLQKKQKKAWVPPFKLRLQKKQKKKHVGPTL